MLLDGSSLRSDKWLEPMFKWVPIFARAVIGEYQDHHRSPALTRHLQELRLARLLHQASRYVPFYRSHFQRHRINIDQIRTSDDLQRIPPVTKDEMLDFGLVRCVDERYSPSLLETTYTTGTMGRKLIVYSSRDEVPQRWGALWAPVLFHGVTPRDQILTVASRHLEIGPPFYQTEYLPDKSDLSTRYAILAKIRPTVIIGFTDAVVILAREVLQRKTMNQLQVRRVFVFGQVLSPLLRETILRAFGVIPIDLYGCTETTWIGIQCPALRGYHVPSGRIIVHISRKDRLLEPAPPTELGEVIVTDLTQRSFPFIRYRLLDMARWDAEPCSCDWKSRRLGVIEGRTQDFFVSEEGRWLPPSQITKKIELRPGFALDYRIVQEGAQTLRVQIVPGPSFNSSEEAWLKAEIRQWMGNVDVSVQTVREFPLDPSGKRRRVLRTFELDEHGRPRSPTAPRTRDTTES